MSPCYEYDATHRLVAIEGHNGNRTAITEAGLYSTLRQFDALDRLTKSTNADNGETVFAYDAFGDLTELDSPDTGVTTYAYDKAGNRISKLAARKLPSAFAPFPGCSLCHEYLVFALDNRGYDLNCPYREGVPVGWSANTFQVGGEVCGYIERDVAICPEGLLPNELVQEVWRER